MPAKILILDDDATTIAQIQPTLEAVGYEVIVALTADAALACLQSTEIAGIVLEVALTDGWAFLVKVKSMPDTARIPVIIYSSLTARSDKIRALEWDAEYYLTKPLAAGYEDDVAMRMRNIIAIQQQIAEQENY